MIKKHFSFRNYYFRLNVYRCDQNHKHTHPSINTNWIRLKEFFFSRAYWYETHIVTTMVRTLTFEQMMIIVLYWLNLWLWLSMGLSALLTLSRETVFRRVQVYFFLIARLKPLQPFLCLCLCYLTRCRHNKHVWNTPNSTQTHEWFGNEIKAWDCQCQSYPPTRAGSSANT